MIKKLVPYTDFNGNSHIAELYFNISKSELADNLDLADQVKSVATTLQSKPDTSTLETSEIKTLLDMVKRFVRLGYGKKSADGAQFRKSSEIWDDFYFSGSYDAFLMSIFENPKEGMDFLVGLLPADLIAQAEKQVSGQESFKFDEAKMPPPLKFDEAVHEPTAPVQPKSDLSQIDIEALVAARVAELRAAETKSGPTDV